MREPRCSRAWQIEARHDGRLTGAEAEAVVAHAERCADCREEQRRFDALLAAVRGAREPRIDDVRRARLKQRVLAAGDAALVRPEPRRAAVRFAVAAVLAVAASVFVYVGRSAPRRASSSVVTRGAEGARYSRRTEHGREVVALVEGEIFVRVRHAGGARESLVTVHVPDGIVRDEGTSFRVRVSRGRTVSIVVTEGRVVFVPSEGRAVHVSAGEHWDAPSAVVAVRTELPVSSPTNGVARPRPPESHARAAIPHEPEAPVPAWPAAAVDPATTEAIEDGLYLDAIAAYRSGDGARARRIASSYLSRFPSGFRRVEMQGFVSSIPPE